ncbi:TPA: carbamate kinase [Enterococcus faecalis]|uniref:carbamate kinase n=1 Tax=Enterococcus faecalis TaxID=1351 RepID=UPI00032F788B|nr:carbamate kinase [Enterococcus faecalis]EOI11507.1 carbamate kinase [Enterococcus faecalis EnGen0244]EOI89571.1 carbamate kinase [Enterococcus faecalis EnGen0298]EOJ90693.1 carbamate kinase [Enterococcus faecalis EnGen0370]EOL55233.1 carbamate kinase [Enterococcus faecalis EnGen0245]HAP4062872.1 carbamate kinase [Enterococcus faecalis]
MGKRVVVALGGNALGNNLTEQMTAVKQTSKAIADLIEAGYEVILSHGNGPQVGMIQLAMEEFSFNNPQYPVVPLSMCVAMSQSYIGYDLENALQEELRQRNISKAVTTVVTQVVVDENDPAFKKTTKPIGRFMTKEEAEQLVKEKNIQVMEDAGRGYRQVVASPKPKNIVELLTIQTLVDAGQTVIAGGGGGIPVIQEGNRLKGVNAVIDKDFCSERLAEQVDADLLVILTAVEKVCINFGKENQEALGNVSTEKMKQYAQEGQFAPGSMLPKVEAAIKFAESKPGRKTLITLLEKAKEGLSGKTGTLIENKES